MRIVLDSNILLRAIISPGGPARAVYQLIQRPHVLVTSMPLLADLGDALRYPRARRRHRHDDAEIDRLVLNIYKVSTYISLPAVRTLPGVCRDPDDDWIIDTAIVGQADVLCTCDNDLFDPVVIRHCQSHGVEVMRDPDLLVRLRANPP